MSNSQYEQAVKREQFDRFALYAKMESNFHLSNKKALFWNLSQYYRQVGKDPFKHLPLTFHIERGVDDPEFHKFQSYFYQVEHIIKQRKNQLRKAMKEARKLKKGKRAREESEDEDEEAVQVKYGVKVPRNIWITKPGENSNRGCGITVCSTLQEIT